MQFHELSQGNSKLYLLEFSNDFQPEKFLDKLTAVEQERYFGFNNLKRQQEFVATRYLKHEIFGYDEIKYLNHGAPFLEQEGYISISHAQNLVGIANNKDFAVGFDIEAIHSKVLKIYNKFLTPKEQSFFSLQSAEELITSWSMKETLYKLAGRKLIDFKKDLVLLDYKEQKARAQINNPTEVLSTNLEALKFKNYIITINSKAVEYAGI